MLAFTANLWLLHVSIVVSIDVCVLGLQGVMQQLVTLGAVSKLPEEAQWNIRVLLPRKNEPTVAPFTVPAARATAPLAAPAVDPAATTAALLGMLLNQSNQISVAPQQVRHCACPCFITP